MKTNKLILAVVSFVSILAIITIPNMAKASTMSTPLYFGINEYRTGAGVDNEDLAYAIKNPYANGTSSDDLKGAKIWQIIKYKDSTATGNYDTGNFYCVRAGVGFNDTTKSAKYTDSFDMKNEKTAIQNSGNTVLKTLVESDNYYSLMALTDLMYLKNESTDSERTALLNLAGIDLSDDSDYTYKITDDDIEAVQQAAVWYFTNSDQSVFDNYDETFANGGDLTKSDWLFTRTSDSETYQSFSDYHLTRSAIGSQTGPGVDRQEQANYLYNYLIKTAKANAEQYKNGTATPTTKVTLYVNLADQNTQPIIDITKIPQDEKEFDLALRKYITKVDGNDVKNSRVPNIDLSTLNDGTTATYKHRKDPVVVKTGSKVTYNITIYNEGEKAGRATKIVDQLPSGLKFLNVITSGFTVEVDSSNNRVTITRNSDNKTDLKAYSNDKLDSETIQLECEVTESASTTTNKILTNVAWIAEEYDSVDNATITNEVGKDRDSEPATTPQIDNLETYQGKDNKSDLTDSTNFYKGYQDDDDFEKLILEKQNDNSYNIVLVKEDANGADLNSTATFNVNGEEKKVTGRLTIVENKSINSTNVNTDDVYVIKETVAPDTYCKFDGTITITVSKQFTDSMYSVKSVDYKVTDESGNDITESSKKTANVYINETGNIYVEVKNYQFDLKLVKRIVEVNGEKVPERINGVDISPLVNRTDTTAKYDLNKDPVSVKKGDIVKYTLRVYNEGDVDGYASEISEDIPDGLEFMWSEKQGDELEADTTLTDLEKEAIKYNQSVYWKIDTIDKGAEKVALIKTNYLAKDRGAELSTDNANLIKAFDSTKSYTDKVNDKNPDYKEVSVYMKVTSETPDKTIIPAGTILRNEAAITGDTDKNGNEIDDRDSHTDVWKKYEDDEDYDNVILQSFDLSLRKFIVAVSDSETISNSDYLKNTDGTYTREPKVDTSKLDTNDESGKRITTAIYNHSKEPVEVEKGNIVVYMIRVYNEGEISGYASEITDHLPPYLQYVNSDFNKKYGWVVSSDGRTVTTDYLKNQLIDKKTTNDDENAVLSYKEVPIMCKVTSDAKDIITNIAEITKFEDEKHQEIKDRDSQESNLNLPSDDELPNYKGDEKGSYIPGQQDDDDFEKVIVKKFDLALRKFITGVNDEKVTNRIPEVKYDSNNNKISYEHTKDPVDVVTGDVVTYTIRVFNEGDMDGYASKISDDIPNGLEFLPENETNKKYGWVMLDENGKETDDVSKANKLMTSYLSKESDDDNLLTAFDRTKEISDTNPSYKDVEIAFKVVEPNSSNKILVNSAQISDDQDKNGKPVEDDDSTPDVWKDGEDDQDREYVKLNEFDLALRKWVTQAIVIENGKESITNTGHKAEDDPEQVVKVELKRKKLTNVTVKFKYSIRVTNEGDIAGYAKEIKDYVPEGLKFVAADNKNWKDEGNNIITTTQLENTLLQPGESAEVQVVLTWINGKDNLGLKTNLAEISKDYNDKNVHDRDSTPDNKAPKEDDIDDAPVLLAVSTGKAQTYTILILSILITLGTGISLIKKYVL